jgi:predicted nucleic acid-binding protein
VITYVDTSALLRAVLREPGALTQLRGHEALVSSELLTVEALRTLDRLRVQGRLTTAQFDERRALVSTWLEAIDLVDLQGSILRRAAEPLPVPLGTLDALHLATALAWRERSPRPLVLATHDASLAQAARVFGLQVLGA